MSILCCLTITSTSEQSMLCRWGTGRHRVVTSQGHEACRWKDWLHPQEAGSQSPHSYPWSYTQSVYVRIVSVINDEFWGRPTPHTHRVSTSLSGRCASSHLPIPFLEYSICKNWLICYAFAILFRLSPAVEELLSYYLEHSALMCFKLFYKTLFGESALIAYSKKTFLGELGRMN